MVTKVVVTRMVTTETKRSPPQEFRLQYACVRQAVSTCHTDRGDQVRTVQIIPARNLYCSRVEQQQLKRLMGED